MQWRSDVKSISVQFIGGPYDGAEFKTNGGPIPDTVVLDKPIHSDEKFEKTTTGGFKIKCVDIGTVTYLHEYRDQKTKSPLCAPKTAMPYLVIESQALKIEIPKD